MADQTQEQLMEFLRRWLGNRVLTEQGEVPPFGPTGALNQELIGKKMAEVFATPSSIQVPDPSSYPSARDINLPKDEAGPKRRSFKGK